MWALVTRVLTQLLVLQAPGLLALLLRLHHL